MRRFYLVCSILGLIAGWNFPTAQAATFIVTRLDDPVPNGCNPGDCSLREAILDANDPAGDNSNIIELGVGTHVLNQTGPVDDDGNKGDLDILNNDLTVNGVDARTTIIDASGANDRVFDVIDSAIEVTLNNMTLRNGNTTMTSAGSLDGGAIAANNGSTLAINDCNITDSQGRNGGGLSVQGGTAAISNSTFSNNAATGSGTFGNGGGLGAISVNLTVSNSTFSGNQASNDGGGLGVGNFGMGPYTVFLRSSTIFDNNADDQGGGVWLVGAGTVNVQNTILAGNTDLGASSDCHNDDTTPGTFVTAGFNVFGSVADCAAPLITDKNDVNDPGLMLLANYGGQTLTHALETNSAAIDNGDPTGCKNNVGSTLPTDQRGQNRDAGGRCDTGSFELGTSDLSVTKSVSANPTQVGSILNYTIDVTNGGPDSNFNVQLTDDLPSEVLFNSVTTDDPTDICSQASGVVSCELGQLDNGDVATITISVTVETNPASGSLTNTVTVQGTEIESDPSNDSFTLTTLVVGGGGCSIASGGVPLARAGGYFAVAMAVAGMWILRHRKK